jgi:hypothetical protein
MRVAWLSKASLDPEQSGTNPSTSELPPPKIPWSPCKCSQPTPPRRRRRGNGGRTRRIRMAWLPRAGRRRRRTAGQRNGPMRRTHGRNAFFRFVPLARWLPFGCCHPRIHTKPFEFANEMLGRGAFRSKIPRKLRMPQCTFQIPSVLTSKS